MQEPFTHCAGGSVGADNQAWKAAARRALECGRRSVLELVTSLDQPGVKLGPHFVSTALGPPTAQADIKMFVLGDNEIKFWSQCPEYIW